MHAMHLSVRLSLLLAGRQAGRKSGNSVGARILFQPEPSVVVFVTGREGIISQDVASVIESQIRSAAGLGRSSTSHALPQTLALPRRIPNMWKGKKSSSPACTVLPRIRRRISRYAGSEEMTSQAIRVESLRQQTRACPGTDGIRWGAFLAP